MRSFVYGIAATLGCMILAVPVVILLVLPRLNWSAAAKPHALERLVANHVLARWVRRDDPCESNPLASTGEDLNAARDEYGEHCAACDGLDGSGRNKFEARFYPPVVKLADEQVQKLSDGQIYFIVAKGICNTAMPGFEEAHSPEEIWRTVLWVRRLV